MDFSAALALLKGGSRLTRASWDDPRRAVSIKDDALYREDKCRAGTYDRVSLRYFPVPEDILANDWRD